MKYKESIGSKIFDIVNYTLMFILVIIMIYPLLNVLSISLSRPDAVIAGNVSWYPIGFNINGYRYIIQDGQIFIGYRNTILYATVGTFLTLLLTSLAAYSLSIKNLLFRKGFTFYWALTMFFSGGLIPSYLNIKNLGLMNTFTVMVLPGAVSAYTLFVFRAFFQQLPVELRESAYIDGANDLYIWAKIIIPLSKPLLATYALFTIVGHWNSWFGALLYLKDPNRYTLQLFLRRLVIQEDVAGSSYANSAGGALIAEGIITPQNAQMAAVIITITPILCIYPFIQRYFVKGVMIGSIKG